MKNLPEGWRTFCFCTAGSGDGGDTDANSKFSDLLVAAFCVCCICYIPQRLKSHILHQRGITNQWTTFKRINGMLSYFRFSTIFHSGKLLISVFPKIFSVNLQGKLRRWRSSRRVFRKPIEFEFEILKFYGGNEILPVGQRPGFRVLFGRQFTVFHSSPFG